MICYDCVEILEILKQNNIDINELNNPPIFIVGYHYSEQGECTKCGSYLNTNDLYVRDENDIVEIKDLSVELLSNKLSSEIEVCCHCDGASIEDYIRVFNKDEDEDEKIQNHVGRDIYDLLDEHGIDPNGELADKIIMNLKCCQCGYGMDRDSGYFDITDRVYSKEEIDSFYSGIRNFGLKYGIEITKTELENFIFKLNDTIMLANTTKTGRKIFNLISKVYENNQGKYITSGFISYRGRKRLKKDKAYETKELWNPPANIASQGRYNILGSSMLYLCDEISMIPHELKLSHGECIDVAEFEMLTSMLLFDVEEMFSQFGDFISTPLESNDIVKSEYLLCNYIAQCCKEIGFDGVRYPSNMNSMVYNYGMFDKDLNQKFKINSIKCFNFEIKYNEER